ncbi:uncharacterized protein FOMMEDRAFT_81588 [Fomitiporia mediterranea MF3/22]|uniref:uncharacterized protein n=1 Tax=Fomitiporia mediterranea (strain MF3/22) TaxID=694068 RepID=UPI0004407631|nr:uncharacterized protein FOMMEDRAFT_81588 [Fomitiporia mediterranea MF3/22]EJD03791.1 hypothetical protein FOMMEDRAFT_81588 [Fomitiporia mediterranea MF3/22]
MISTLDTAPPIHRIKEGTQSLDREIFRKSIPVLAARIPAPKSGRFLDGLKNDVLDLRRCRTVVHDKEDKGRRLVLLNYQNRDELPARVNEFIEREGATLMVYEIELDYSYWTAVDILEATLPEELCTELPTGFAAMGHLAHLNLNAEFLPYKYIIGQIILDKNPRLRTVVNKLDTIHNQFRYFDMELIAGEPDFIVQHSESNCRFTFDFREVYWNSRLHTEHDRLVQLFQPEDGVIADVMAGVGPFAVPAAKKGCTVLANDLNPNSVKWLRKNVDDNNVSKNIRVYCEDGKDFIRLAFKRVFTEPFDPVCGQTLSKRKQQKEERRRRLSASKDEASVPNEPEPTPATPALRNRIGHFVMNLPDSAIEFLDAFRGVLDPLDRELSGVYETMPMVHCHCFTRFLDAGLAEADIRKRVEESLGGELEKEVTLHYVRSVAPNKDMYCISFRLPQKLAFQ